MKTMVMTKTSTSLTREIMTPRRKVGFKVMAPEANDVFLVGDFNNWDSSSHPLKCNSKGIWSTSITLPLGRYEYRFLIDGEWWNDPSYAAIVPNPFGSNNCAIILD